MKLEIDNVYVGNINKCTKYVTNNLFSSNNFMFGSINQEVTPYKKNAILLKVKNGGYVDIQNIKSNIDILKIYRDLLLSPNGFYRTNNNLMISTRPTKENDLCVDVDSLKPYYIGHNPKEADITSIKRLTKNNKYN